MNQPNYMTSSGGRINQGLLKKRFSKMLTRGTSRKRSHEDSFEEKYERIKIAKKKSEEAKKKKINEQTQMIEALKAKESFNSRTTGYV